jgi:prevent-host-death family protein
MKTMVISEFKAKCIAVVKQVQRKGEPVLLTIRGKPVAEVRPLARELPKRVLGAQRGAIDVVGDIIRTDDSDDWEMISNPDRVLNPDLPRT